MDPILKQLAQRWRGVCKFYNPKAGFGFITSDIDGQDLFFNANHLCNGEKVGAGTKVTFVAGRNQRGKIADFVRAE